MTFFRTGRIPRLALAAFTSILALSARAQTVPDWAPGFALAAPGTDDEVLCSTVFDDGGGPRLYAAGRFTSVDDVVTPRIARWDGERWSAVVGMDGVAGPNQGIARMVESEGDLWVGGAFGSVGAEGATSIARWNGQRWHAERITTATETFVSAHVFAMGVFDLGDGPQLFIAGGFFTPQGQTFRVLRRAGAVWEQVGASLNQGGVTCMAAYDDGAGPQLFIGGWFTMVGSMPISHVAKWDGAAWQPVGSGLNGAPLALRVHDDGSGPALFAGGTFTQAGGAPALNVAKYRGGGWMALGAGVGGQPSWGAAVYSMATYDDGDDSSLIVAGAFTMAGGTTANAIASWNGDEWSTLGDGVGPTDGVIVDTLTPFPAPTGPSLFAGGVFALAGDTAVANVAAWDGEQWSSFGPARETRGINNVIRALHVAWIDGEEALYAGGEFSVAGTTMADRLARWDGNEWRSLAVFGLAYPNSAIVAAISDADLGEGPRLYVGGNFTAIDGVPANYIASWDGKIWAALGTGLGESIGSPSLRDIEAFNDGGGPALYVVGEFDFAGGSPAAAIARWRNGAWSALPGVPAPATANALGVFDDGTGAALYVGSGSGGNASVLGPLRGGLTRWNGSAWNTVGGGVRGTVQRMIVHDDGRGPALYIAGQFDRVGALPVNNIARWDGQAWEALGTGLSDDSYTSVSALSSVADGAGRMLVAGGLFDRAGDRSALNIARWDGQRWLAMREGMSGQNIGSGVFALAAYRGGGTAASTQESLYAGGVFSIAGDVVSRAIARWDVNSERCAGDTNGDDVIDMADLNAALTSFGQYGAWDADIDGDGDVDFVDLNILLTNFGASCPQ